MLQRDPCNALMLTADTQTDSGLSGRVDTWILKSEVCRWWESDEPPQSVGGKKLPEGLPRFQEGPLVLSLPHMGSILSLPLMQGAHTVRKPFRTLLPLLTPSKMTGR